MLLNTFLIKFNLNEQILRTKLFEKGKAKALPIYYLIRFFR